MRRVFNWSTSQLELLYKQDCGIFKMARTSGSRETIAVIACVIGKTRDVRPWPWLGLKDWK